MKLNIKLLVISFVIGIIIGLPSYMQLLGKVGNSEQVGLFLFSFLSSQVIYTLEVAIVLSLGIWLLKKLGIMQSKK